MLRPSALVLAALLAMGAMGADCDGPGTFTPNPVDAGVDPNAVTVLDIGVPCTYDLTDPTPDNPTNQCKNGLTCMISTSDGAITSDYDLPGWEDQFTTFAQDVDSGFCTLKGTYASPPNCPAGTALKLVWSNTAICVRTCSAPAECGRADYTCDTRYLDLPPSCVRKCSLDVPDCIRSGITQGQDGALIPVLSFEDMQGDSECNPESGQCQFVEQHGVAGPGEPCNSSRDCEAGSGACVQAPVLGALLATDVNIDGPGFCASPCTPVDPTQVDPQSNCTVGYVCQAAGNLNINFNLIGGPLVRADNGAIDARGGFCFHQCELGVESACDPFPGTACGSFDEAAANDLWNGITQCLPDPLRL